MLVLTRRSNQSIIIGEDIEVTVLGVSGDKVRIGISAPTDVPVYREEVFDRIAAGEPTIQDAGSTGVGASNSPPPSRNGSTPDEG